MKIQPSDRWFKYSSSLGVSREDFFRGIRAQLSYQHFISMFLITLSWSPVVDSKSVTVLRAESSVGKI